MIVKKHMKSYYGCQCQGFQNNLQSELENAWLTIVARVLKTNGLMKLTMTCIKWHVLIT